VLRLCTARLLPSPKLQHPKLSDPQLPCPDLLSAFLLRVHRHRVFVRMFLRLRRLGARRTDCLLASSQVLPRDKLLRTR
jgi:hypothetical protein